MHVVTAAAVFVNPGACAVGRRQHVFAFSGGGLDDNAASGFLRAALDMKQCITGLPDFVDANAVADDELSAYL